MRRIRRGFIFTLVFLLTLSGCSSKQGESSGDKALDPNNPVTITLWHYYLGDNKVVLETMAEEFNSTVGLEQGIIVQTVGQGSIKELEDKVTSSVKGVINSDPMPDMFSSYPDKAMELDELGVLVDLNKYFTQEDKERYIPQFLKEGEFDGERFLLVPIVKSTEIFYINDTEWKEFTSAIGSDPSLKYWEDVLDTAKIYYQWSDSLTPDKPRDGKSLMGFDSLANFIIVGSKQLGIEVIEKALVVQI